MTFNKAARREQGSSLQHGVAWMIASRELFAPISCLRLVTHDQMFQKMLPYHPGRRWTRPEHPKGILYPLISPREKVQGIAGSQRTLSFSERMRPCNWIGASVNGLWQTLSFRQCVCVFLCVCCCSPGVSCTGVTWVGMKLSEPKDHLSLAIPSFGCSYCVDVHFWSCLLRRLCDLVSASHGAALYRKMQCRIITTHGAAPASSAQRQCNRTGKSNDKHTKMLHMKRFTALLYALQQPGTWLGHPGSRFDMAQAISGQMTQKWLLGPGNDPKSHFESFFGPSQVTLLGAGKVKSFWVTFFCLLMIWGFGVCKRFGRSQV